MSSNPTNPAQGAGIHGVSTMEASIDELNLQPGEYIEINYDAPEPGSSFPPRLKPGAYDFKFELEDEPFGRTSWEKDGHNFFEVRHRAIITRTNQDGSQEDVTIRFIRANTFQNDAMRKAQMNASIGELMRSLNIHLDNPIHTPVIEDSLRAADGRAYGRMMIGWRAQLPSGVIYSTHPRKKKGEVAWPKDDKGMYELMVTDPSTGQKAYGRENLINYQFLSSHSSKPKDDVQFS